MSQKLVENYSMNIHGQEVTQVPGNASITIVTMREDSEEEESLKFDCQSLYCNEHNK